jgi:hypothetical protein
MLPIDYLLIAFSAVLLLGGVALITAVGKATEGYEDEFGFHAGPTPAWILLGPASAPATAYTPDASTRACVPEAPAAQQPEARTIRGSKPPMLPADLQADDLHPRPPQRHDASDKADRL